MIRTFVVDESAAEEVEAQAGSDVERTDALALVALRFVVEIEAG